MTRHWSPDPALEVKIQNVNIELINTGTELLLGRTLNTHHQWMAQRLKDLGLRIHQQHTIADTSSEIVSTVLASLQRSELVLVTGGLGPTADDLTRQVLAEALGLKLVENAQVWEFISGYFTRRNKSVPPNAKVQAQVPEGATVLWNKFGTAPGLWIDVSPGKFGADARALVLLPGPPRELKPMFDTEFIPLLTSKFSSLPKLQVITLRTTGLGESWIEEAIAPHLKDLMEAGLDVGYCAKISEVEIRLAAEGEAASELVLNAEKLVRRLLRNHIFGAGNETLEQVVIESLKQSKKTVAVAESCTGGYLGNRLTNVPGASEVFLGGMLTYSNDSKVKLLGVSPETLKSHGAVSEATAREMAEGCRKSLGADFALSVTGIAGPGGGTEEKPIGTVYIALAGGDKTIVESQVNSYDRETFKFVTTQQALNLLRKALQ
jgi:nicotinamide-nucleotide amidase